MGSVSTRTNAVVHVPGSETAMASEGVLPAATSGVAEPALSTGVTEPVTEGVVPETSDLVGQSEVLESAPSAALEESKKEEIEQKSPVDIAAD